MSMLIVLYPSTEYLLRALGLESPQGFVVALIFFLLVASLALTFGARRLNRRKANR